MKLPLPQQSGSGRNAAQLTVRLPHPTRVKECGTNHRRQVHGGNLEEGLQQETVTGPGAAMGLAVAHPADIVEVSVDRVQTMGCGQPLPHTLRPRHRQIHSASSQAFSSLPRTAMVDTQHTTSLPLAMLSLHPQSTRLPLLSTHLLYLRHPGVIVRIMEGSDFRRSTSTGMAILDCPRCRTVPSRHGHSLRHIALSRGGHRRLLKGTHINGKMNVGNITPVENFDQEPDPLIS